ncbi:MAG: hypothetical protein JWL77_86, partial [Chthonomonadaceae bacterium]|nr:hypothetical protein [Chthonomonadaceae bacterium]
MILAAMVFSVLAFVTGQGAPYPAPKQGDFIVKDFTFKSGEHLPEVKLHYYTLGSPVKDASGKVRNAV